MKYRCFCYVYLAWLAMVALGCGGKPNKVPVNGQLLYEDGKPVEEATIRFVPEGSGQEEAGVTGKDGKFMMMSLPGNYAVVVHKAASASPGSATVSSSPEDMAAAMKKVMATSKPKAKAVDPVSTIYATPEKTPLKCKVETSETKVEFKLKRG